MKTINANGERGTRSEVYALYVFLFSLFFSPSFFLAQDAPPPTLDPKVFEIAYQLRCPVCTAQSVGDSASPIAVEMRNVIQE